MERSLSDLTRFEEKDFWGIKAYYKISNDKLEYVPDKYIVAMWAIPFNSKETIIPALANGYYECHGRTRFLRFKDSEEVQNRQKQKDSWPKSHFLKLLSWRE